MKHSSSLCLSHNVFGKTTFKSFCAASELFQKMFLSFKVVVNYKVAELTPRERAMLDFAMAVCRCDTITEEHFRSLEEVGFDREDAWDIAAIAAFFAMSNRLAHLTDMRPNLEFFNMGRVPRDKSSNKAEEK